MRIFDDAEGGRWEAATAFGSYGEAHLIFSRMEANELRTSAMNASTLREAERELAELSEESLLDRLSKATPWQ